MRRRLLVGAVLALLATPTAAQQAAAPQTRRPPRRRAPPPAPPPVADTRRGDPAPVPNLDIEAPRRRDTAQPAARLDPTLIDPAEPRFGTATDRNSLQAREDRLLRQPAPGARLRLPFAY
jgi:hypothetical protein